MNNTCAEISFLRKFHVVDLWPDSLLKLTPHLVSFPLSILNIWDGLYVMGTLPWNRIIKVELHLKHSVDFIFELTLYSWRFDPSHHHLLQPTFLNSLRFRLSPWIFTKILNCYNKLNRPVLFQTSFETYSRDTPNEVYL